jgi:5'-nucleotidase
MKILVANDDSIFAEGIRTLAAVLGREHEVFICAPDRERSATGHSMSLNKPLMVDPLTKRIPWIENIADGCVTSGTPADCVKIALNQVWEGVKFDLTISGINHGPNLGIDVLYSGTVSAAMESMLIGVPAIATSLYSYSSKEFLPAANWILDFIREKDFYKILPERTFLNINFPAGARENYEGEEVTTLGKRTYSERFEERIDPRGRKYFWLAGDPINEHEEPGMDGYALMHNKVSITPVRFDMTNHEFISKLQSLI